MNETDATTGARRTTPRWAARIGRTVRAAALFVLAVVLVFVLIEGASSTALFAFYMIRHAQPFQERRHADHDVELGWVNRPGVRIENLYGRGMNLTTNARGFRGAADVDSAIPPGRRRVVCSGDSFTMGYGVDDTQTWCAVLRELDPSLESVNMGQGGYGIDQAYLWYLRDGTRIEHDVHLFSFITDDYDRMRRTQFGGYEKPVLTVAGDSLVVGNVPVPRAGYFRTWMARAGPDIGQLGVVRALGKVLGRIAPGVLDRDEGRRVLTNDEVREAAWLVFDDLARINAAEGRQLILVHLPVGEDYLESGSDAWRIQLRMRADSVGLPFLDLVKAFRELPPAEADSMFFPYDSPGGGHYTVAGNRWVAEQVIGFLAECVEPTGIAVQRRDPDDAERARMPVNSCL